MALNAEDIFALFRETTLKFQETDRKFQETDRKIQEFATESQESRQALDRQLKELSRNVGNVNNRLGQCVEEMIQPAVLRLFQARGIEVHEIMRNLIGNRDGLAAEIDLLAVDTTEAVAVEVESNLAEEHVDQHVQRMNLSQ